MLCLVIVTITFGCSSDDDNNIAPIDDRSFTTNTATDFFINHDGTINLMVSGAFTDLSPSSTVRSRGFVYGTTTNTEVNATNTVIAIGPQNSVTGNIQDLPSGRTYFIRGYFEMSDNSFFYGSEIQASTDVDASSTRSLKMEILSTPFFVNSNTITPTINITELEKESPKEIGIEYSLNSDFSNSSMKSFTPTTSGFGGNIRVTDYSTVAIEGLTISTLYYMRPYAKYVDGTVTNGGTSTTSISTSN